MENPNHIGIILDGNRRFAKRLMLEPWKGHEYGAEKVQKLLDWAKELDVKEFTLYCLSSENINSRPKNELKYLFKIFRKEFREIDKEKIDKYKIKIRFIGNLDLLPEDLAEQCRELERKTAKNTDYIINFAIAYGGRIEIIEAIKKIIKNKISPEEVTEKVIEDNLYMKDCPDLIIRTGGEKRTSNFLPWQASYSEWLFLDKMWPEFEKQDLINAIENFKKR
ncbi:MAG: di-trans,poly-cis-decaprenylcistransferase, partial [Nanoarchaeota archaeon]|nr:di-trans,poly-cis-decaprenylcistransferase [Nanoarchaeota archaeon]